MNKVIMHKLIGCAALNQPAATSAARSARVIHPPRRRGAIGAIPLPTARQLAADRAGRAAKKPTDRLLAAAATILCENHATFLAAEVLASSVHRNTLCPSGHGCCT
jgi:hypothetical protein